MVKVLTFRLADGLYGIEIDHIKEINRNVEYTPVPRASDTIVGLFNMRGQIVTLFNLAKLLGSDNPPKDQKATCIVLKSAPNNPNQQGFLIEAAGDVIDLEADRCEPPPANVDGNGCKFIKQVARLDTELVMIIEPELIFQ